MLSKTEHKTKKEAVKLGAAAEQAVTASSKSAKEAEAAVQI